MFGWINPNNKFGYFIGDCDQVPWFPGLPGQMGFPVGGGRMGRNFLKCGVK